MSSRQRLTETRKDGSLLQFLPTVYARRCIEPFSVPSGDGIPRFILHAAKVSFWDSINNSADDKLVVDGVSPNLTTFNFMLTGRFVAVYVTLAFSTTSTTLRPCLDPSLFFNMVA